MLQSPGSARVIYRKRTRSSALPVMLLLILIAPGWLERDRESKGERQSGAATASQEIIKLGREGKANKARGRPARRKTGLPAWSLLASGDRPCK